MKLCKNITAVMIIHFFSPRKGNWLNNHLNFINSYEWDFIPFIRWIFFLHFSFFIFQFQSSYVLYNVFSRLYSFCLLFSSGLDLLEVNTLLDWESTLDLPRDRVLDLLGWDRLLWRCVTWGEGCINVQARCQASFLVHRSRHSPLRGVGTPDPTPYPST